VAPAVLGAMNDTLRHRGPDDAGTWTARLAGPDAGVSVGLGHRRLSILDLSPAGHQPMVSDDGSVAIAYNGEVYNFRALRDELEQVGHAFRSECDTEVILQAYRQWGLEAFARLNGMFAIALVDVPRGRVVLVRDRLGIKPLFWRFHRGVLLFGSELQALRAHPAFDDDIDRVAVGQFLRHGYVPGPRTIYERTRRLQPGEVLVHEGGAVRLERFFDLCDADAVPEPPPDWESAVDGLEALVSDAVGLRLVSDVPLGAFLSGGVDSSLVAALMRKTATGPVRTFTIGFDDVRYNEAPFAKDVAKHLGTEHTELYVGTDAARDVACELPTLYDEPFADSSSIPTVLLSRLTRQHVTVALSGDGGDELFGGYAQYAKLPRLLPWLRLPAPVRRPLAALGESLSDGPARNALRHLRAKGPAELAYRLVSAFEGRLLSATLGPEALEPSRVYFEAFHRAPARTPVQRSMTADASVYLPDDILVKVDRATMSVALEARVPLLDWRVVRFAQGLPLAFHWRGGETKAPLRAVLDRHVPRHLIERPKHGFGIPIGTLLAREIEEWTRTYLAPARLREEGILDPDGVAMLLAEARRRAGTQPGTNMVWKLLCFQRWLAHNHRREPLS